MVEETPTTQQGINRRTIALVSAAIALIVLGILSTKVGFYSVQPIGALPEGVTLLVWRVEGEPFWNSPDAVSLSRTGSVSILSRGLALSSAPKSDRIIARLSYWEYAYLRSTGGKSFDR